MEGTPHQRNVSSSTRKHQNSRNQSCLGLSSHRMIMNIAGTVFAAAFREGKVCGLLDALRVSSMVVDQPWNLMCVWEVDSKCQNTPVQMEFWSRPHVSKQRFVICTKGRLNTWHRIKHAYKPSSLLYPDANRKRCLFLFCF